MLGIYGTDHKLFTNTDLTCIGYQL